MLLYVKMMDSFTCGEDKKMPCRGAEHVQPAALRSVGSQPLISSVVTLIMHRIIALVLFDIDQEK